MKVMSVALATSFSGSATAIAAITTADNRIAPWGVRRFGCTRANCRGRLKSRPIAKETREEE